MTSRAALQLATILGTLVIVLGCGASKQRLATEQLVISDAVDRTVAKIDFRPLAGQTVYLDTKYVANAKGNSFVNTDYVISSLRQQMLGHGLYLQEKIEDAEYVVEVRIGVLGNDGHDVAFGIPPGNQMGVTAASLTGYPVPAILPEISLAKRSDNLGAAKVAVFAYHKTTREPVWQSGIATTISTAKDYWLLGIGPLQRGSIYAGTQFAGEPIQPLAIHPAPNVWAPIAAIYDEAHFLERAITDGAKRTLLPSEEHESTATKPDEPQKETTSR